MYVRSVAIAVAAVGAYGDPTCKSHPACSHLAGNCCPTASGVTLGCCGSPSPPTPPAPSPGPPTPPSPPAPSDFNHRLTITNGCSEMPIWISNYAAHYKHVSGIEPNAKIEPMQSRLFPMNAAGAAYYPKYGCDSSGDHCVSGDKGSKPRTLFEFTYPAYGTGDAWDMSLVDGYNLPFKLELVDCTATNPHTLPPASVIDCSQLSMADCPTSEYLGGQIYDLAHPPSGQKGCMAPCFELQYSHISARSPQAEQYCCQNSYIGPKCRSGAILQTHWYKNIRAKCRHTYTYPLDDTEGNQACAKPDRKYHLTFYCPGGAETSNSTGVIV